MTKPTHLFFIIFFFTQLFFSDQSANLAISLFLCHLRCRLRLSFSLPRLSRTYIYTHIRDMTTFWNVQELKTLNLSPHKTHKWRIGVRCCFHVHLYRLIVACQEIKQKMQLIRTQAKKRKAKVRRRKRKNRGWPFRQEVRLIFSTMDTGGGSTAKKLSRTIHSPGAIISAHKKDAE